MREKTQIGAELLAWVQGAGTHLLMPAVVYDELELLALNNVQCNQMDWTAHKRRYHQK